MSISQSNAKVFSLLASSKLSMVKIGVHFRHYEQDESYEISKSQKEEIFEHSKSLNKKGDKKRVKFATNGQKFNKINMSKRLLKR